jgi:hypothetical protein
MNKHACQVNVGDWIEGYGEVRSVYRTDDDGLRFTFVGEPALNLIVGEGEGCTVPVAERTAGR